MILANQIAVVTGAGTGVGRAASLALIHRFRDVSNVSELICLLQIT